MHHSLFPAVAALALVLPGAVSAQEGPLAMQQITHVDPSIEQEIVAIRDTAWRAYFANDQATMARLFPANFISIGWSGGPWLDRAGNFTGPSAPLSITTDFTKPSITSANFLNQWATDGGFRRTCIGRLVGKKRDDDNRAPRGECA